MHQFRIRRFAIFAAALAGAMMLSCQTTSAPSRGPVDLWSEPFSIKEAMRPDSASFERDGRSAGARLAVDSSRASAYKVFVHLDAPLGDAPLEVTFWRNGIMVWKSVFTRKEDELRLKSSNIDPVAALVLTTLDSLSKSLPAQYPDTADSSMAKAFGVLLVAGDTTLRDGMGSAPRGLDTAASRRFALVHAVATRKSLPELVSTWKLGMDSAQAAEAIRALVPGTIDSSSVEHLFPTPPVRIQTGIAVADSIFSDSASTGVSGRFVGKNRLFGPYFRVLSGNVVVPGHFELQSSKSPTANSWDLSTDGQATLRAFGTAAPGKYLLQVWMEDASGFSDTSSTEFVVRVRPDATGPTLQRKHPGPFATLPYDDSLETIVVAASDPSGIRSVAIGETAMAKTDSGWELEVKVPPTGLWTEFVVVATDSAGNSKELPVQIQRSSKDDARPKLSFVSPAARTGDTIPASQGTREIVCHATDVNPITLVSIGGVNAVAGSDSTWKATVPVPQTGTATPILVQALNDKGNGALDTVWIVRRKDLQAPRISAMAGTRGVAFDSASAKVSWKVWDESSLDSVWIGSVLQTRRQDSVYSTILANLAVGNNPVAIRAKDAAGNVAYDTQIVVRAANTLPPQIKRLADVADGQVFVFGATDSVVVGWKVSGNEKIDSVWINGTPAPASHDTFSLRIALGAGKVPVAVLARNLSGLTARDSITLETKLKDKDGNLYAIRRMPDGRVWMGQNLRTNPALLTATCARSNCSRYGSLYRWTQATALDTSYRAKSYGYNDSSSVTGICPTGWRLPTRKEWSGLLVATMPKAAKDSAHALKSRTEWVDSSCTQDGGTTTCTVNDHNGSDLFEEFLLPNVRNAGGGGGSFGSGMFAQFWLAAESGTQTAASIHFRLPTTSTPGGTATVNYSKTNPLGVRCIQAQRLIKFPLGDVILEKPILLSTP